MAFVSPMIFLAKRALLLASQLFHQGAKVQQEGISTWSVLQHVANPRKTLVGQGRRGELFIQATQQFPLRKHFEDAAGLILVQNGGQLTRLLVSIQAFPGALGQSGVEPALGAFIRVKVEAHSQAQQSERCGRDRQRRSGIAGRESPAARYRRRRWWGQAASRGS